MYIRKVVEIPAAGVTEYVNMAGAAVVVERMETYSLFQNPFLHFDSLSGIPQPLYPQSIYLNARGEPFTKLALTGTAESAGDTISFLISDVCLEPKISPVSAFNQAPVEAGTSFSIASTNAAQTIPPAALANSDGLLPYAVTIAAADNDIAYAFKATPVQGGLGYILPVGAEPVQQLRIEGIDFILNFEFISAVADTHGELIVTAEYRPL